MKWVKLSDEKPTEDGLYMIAYKNSVSPVLYSLDEVNLVFSDKNYTHWLLIQPPKGEKK